MNFKSYPLGNLVNIRYGKNQKKVASEKGTFPIYGTGGLMGYATEPLYDKPSVLIGRKGTIDKVRYVTHPFWTVDTLFYTEIDDTKVLPHYLYYYLSLLDLKKYNEGTTIPSLRTETLNRIEISVPEIEEQQCVLALLEPIDSKIETNKQINDNLQQQLFSLYENMATASPCLKEYTLSNLCDFQEGYVNPPQTHPEYFDGEVKWLRAVDINESFIIETSRTLTKAGFESAKKSALLFEPNTIAISKSGTIGRLGIIADYMCGNRAVINIAPHDTNMLAFIYCFLKSKQREFPDMAVGSVQKNLYVSLLEPLSVSIPDNESLTAFNAVGASILGMIHNNCVENTDLANLRDTILPKLMSGEIDVSSVLL